MPANKPPNADKAHKTTSTRRNPGASDEPQKRIPTDGAEDDVRIADEEGDPRRTGHRPGSDPNPGTNNPGRNNPGGDAKRR